MKNAFLTFERWTTFIAMLGACAMLTLASALGMFQIVTRFVLEQPAEWTEVLIRFSLIWMVFLAIPAAFRQGAMVSVDVLYRWSPPRIKRVLDWVVALAALALIGIIIWYGWDYAQRGGGAEHGRAGVRVHVLGLPRHAGGGAFLHRRHHWQPH